MSNFTQPLEQSTGLVDQAAASADQAIDSTRRAAADTLHRSSEQLAALAHRGTQAVREGSQKVREQALHATDATVGYIRHEPVKAMLIAAATGAVLTALIGLLFRSRSS